MQSTFLSLTRKVRLGLLILSVLSALVVNGTVSILEVLQISLKAITFLVGSIGIGMWLTPKLVKRLAKSEINNIRTPDIPLGKLSKIT
jgi:Kef-type K+ transport system membrane component KefB